MTELADISLLPESLCGRCGGPNSVWAAPSPLWNAVMRGGDINGGPEPHGGIVCPTCFMILAEEAGVADTWVLRATNVHTELQTVTPSGRIWNDAKMLWIDAQPDSSGPGSNTGHGHVWKRPDGVRSRCGGPRLCRKCQQDQARWT